MDQRKVLIPAWIFEKTDRYNRFLLGIAPDGTVTIDGGHDTPNSVAKALKLFNSIACIKPKENTRWVMITVEEVSEFEGMVNQDAIDTLNTAYEELNELG